MNDTDFLPGGATDLRDRMARAVQPEPPFEVPLDDAVAAAVRGGRRRRTRVMASRGLALVACAAVVGGAAFAVRPGGSPAPVAAGGGTPAASAASSPSCVDRLRAVESPPMHGGPSLSSTGALAYVRARGEDGARPAPCDDGGYVGLMIHDKPVNSVPDVSSTQLVPLAKAIAGGNGADVYLLVQRRDAPGIPTVVVDASGAAGPYEVTVSVIGQDYDTASWTSSCTPDRTDDKPCKVELAEHDRTASSVTFSDGSGRTSLTYAQDAGSGRTLLVNVDNYVEHASGDKTVGPTWKQVGLTPSYLADAVAASGPLD